jgi:3-methyladenine DNA glycosylase AlkD
VLQDEQPARRPDHVVLRKYGEEKHPEIVPDVVAWTGSSNMRLRRAAAVAFIPLVRRKQQLDTAYDVATRLFDDEEDLMHKAVGRLLREAENRTCDASRAS